MKTLKETSVGETVKVVKLNGSGPVSYTHLDVYKRQVGGYDKIRHVMLHFSAGSGFFYTVDGDITLNQAFLDEVKAYMHEQVEKAVPIYKRSVDTHEARERFRLHGMTDKDRLFRYRRVSRVNLYSLGDFEDYYYGFMTYDTSYLKYFDLYLYDDGFVLQMPEKKAPEDVYKRQM